MADLDLGPVMARYSRALDAKPSKGPWTDERVAWITDSVCDIPQLLAEVERLAEWKASALAIMDGLQELGQALGLPLGVRITGPEAVAEVQRLRDTLAASYCEHGSSGSYLCELIHMDESSLSARADAAEAVLRDFASHGVRADLTPTLNGASTEVLYAGIYAYLERIDGSVRERARRALEEVDRG